MDKKSEHLPTGLSITQVELDIVENESRETGINNFSATIRKIIREWAILTGKVKEFPVKESK